MQFLYIFFFGIIQSRAVNWLNVQCSEIENCTFKTKNKVSVIIIIIIIFIIIIIIIIIIRCTRRIPVIINFSIVIFRKGERHTD